jgi:polysaccharide biosynthesis/export protein
MRLLFVGACTFLFSGATFAQQRAGGSLSVPPSDLASDNQERVAASEAQIVAVLGDNSGLLVELKRWVAKDAADHGQVVEDADLDDTAIFARLSRDQKFRAAATRILQRYGYLLPKLNPESDMAQEHDLLVKERVRLLAAQQERDQTNAATASSAGSAPGATANCTMNAPADCQGREQRGARQSAVPMPGPQDYSPDLPAGDNPGQLTVPAYTPGNPNGSLVDLESPGQQRNGGGLQAMGLDGERNPATLPPNDAGDRASNDSEGGLGEDSGGIGGGSDGIDSGLGSLPAQNDRTAGGNRGPDQRTRAGLAAPRGYESDHGIGEKTSGGFEVESAAEAGPPAMARRWSPYSDVPSLYDMFVQGATPASEVERFGKQLFRNAPALGDGQAIPIDFPASPDYVVGPGDGLAIDLWGGVSERLVRVIDREGRVSLPEVGPIAVNGQSLEQVQETLERVLRTQFHEESADVSLSRLRTIRVYVVGEVNRPGPYDISSLSTPLNALLAAGGPSTNGSLRLVDHYRGSLLVQRVDLYDLLLRGVRTDIQRLESGDTLLVPPVGAEMRIDGMVRRPAIYELREETTLAQALDLAGGILPTAALSHIEVQRLDAHEKRTMLSLDISGTTDPTEAEKKLADFQIRDRDEVHIFPIATFNQDAVYLQGHVVRAGRYAFTPGMKLTDLISSYSELLPEPATKYAEIIRLNPPDYRPSVESFDLAAALSNPASAPKLEALDTVRIFSRYDFENPPTVSVNGAVRRPGTFQTTGQIHFREAIELASGVLPDAAMDAAQIIRTMPDSSLKILSVELKAALAGDPLDDVLLEPRDRILIQRNPLRADPPTVLIQGELANPGRYPLTDNVHVSDLIAEAGGVERSAYKQSADLTRFNPSAGEDKLGEHLEVNLAAILAGDHSADIPLRDGDVLTIRQLAAWNDIGASVRLTGEVEHPGTYGIQPGERLSSVLKRAGGFSPQAYVYAAVLDRPEVRDLEDKSRQELIQQIQAQQAQLKAATAQIDPSEKADQQAAIEQLQLMLERVQTNVSAGRMVIHISSDLKEWQGAVNDVALRDGDSLLVPKMPNFVLVNGAVFHQTAITYRPGRSAKWYLAQAGGPTQMADRKGIFVIRADGSIASAQSSSGLWKGDPLSAALRPGDMVVVPEKALGPNSRWKTVLQTAQTFSSIATSAAIAVKF